MNTVLHQTADGDVYVRIGIVATLFVRGPLVEAAPIFRSVFESWLSFVPEDGKRWSVIGTNAEDEKPFDKGALTRALAQFDPAKAAKRQGAHVEVTGPRYPGGEWSCELELNEVKETGTKCHFFDLVFPFSFGQSPQVERLLEFITTLAKRVPFDSGYVSPAIVYPYMTDLKGGDAVISPNAFRHPGYDVPANSSTAWRVGGLCRGARWVTFLGPGQVGALGGVEAISRHAAQGVSVESIGHGVMLRAGDAPEIGDVNRGEDLPLLRAMASQLKPITLFKDASLVAYLGGRAFDWEQRFFV